MRGGCRSGELWCSAREPQGKEPERAFPPSSATDLELEELGIPPKKDRVRELLPPVGEVPLSVLDTVAGVSQLLDREIRSRAERCFAIIEEGGHAHDGHDASVSHLLALGDSQPHHALDSDEEQNHPHDEANEDHETDEQQGSQAKQQRRAYVHVNVSFSIRELSVTVP
jgi:hypothetical protein